MQIGKNLGNMASDGFDRYFKTPIKSGHPERLAITIPAGIVNMFSNRFFDAVISGGAGVSLDVPDGTLAEVKRDGSLVKAHALPPKPVKLAADIIRLPGSATSGLIDAAVGTDSRYGSAA